jgi:glycosyltransferase involved in cell wall biosynthesis
VPEQADAHELSPRFTIISPVYNVEKYLEDFIRSVESQLFSLDHVEVVMVDDGSTDSSPRILSEWQARRPELVTVVTQQNGGIGSARNAGLRSARGEWVTFPDPDDTMSPNYLSEVDAFINQQPSVGMVAAKRTSFDEANGRLLPHPLAAHFDAPNRVINLDEHADLFHGAVNTAFFRHGVLIHERLRFDERIRPNFEDGQFCIGYLLRLERPTVGFVRTAEYTYRKRADKSSAMDTSGADPRRYTVVLEHGFLDALQQACSRRGSVPQWVQSYILYELSWYFQIEESAGEVASAAVGEVADEFHRLLARIVELLDPAVIKDFRLRRFDNVWRDVLLHSYEARPWHPSFALVSKLDTSQGLVRVSYRYSRVRPAEAYFSDGVLVEPVFEKTRSIDYFDRTLLFERIVWLPAGAIRVMLDGAHVDVRTREPDRPRHSLPLRNIRETFVPRLVAERRERARATARRQPLKLSERLLVRAARTKLVRRYFAKAWVLMDRVDNADDSAELLFRYLRTHRKRVNAWFVISKGTPDHRRLLADGYKRVIPHGSLRWKLLMLNCRHLVSSHADGPIWRPQEITRLAPPGWRFTFLQHGVMKDDLSRWLNPKDLDLFITSTRAEYESVVADGSPYRYSERETKLTGLPRFDALLEAGELVPPDRRDLILVAPTWRNWLTETRPGGARSTVRTSEFVASDFGVNWLGLISSQELKSLADEQGLKVALLLHPDLQALSDELDLPDHVEVLRFAGHDVRGAFARARVLVTDYSSIAFNAAYIERPVVYFQFDRVRVQRGGHLGRRGYFDYDRDGFGPVATSLEAVLPAISETVRCGPSPRPEYLARMSEAFPERDGRCTERVFLAIRASMRGQATSAEESAHATSVEPGPVPRQRATTPMDPGPLTGVAQASPADRSGTRPRPPSRT